MCEVQFRSLRQTIVTCSELEHCILWQYYVYTYTSLPQLSEYLCFSNTLGMLMKKSLKQFTTWHVFMYLSWTKLSIRTLVILKLFLKKKYFQKTEIKLFISKLNNRFTVFWWDVNNFYIKCCRIYFMITGFLYCWC